MFIEVLTYNHGYIPIAPSSPWHYKYLDETGFDYNPRVAGFHKNFRHKTTNIAFLTVKGAGLHVSLDRPGPALQMINSFVNNITLNTSLPYSLIKPQRLFPNYTSQPIPLDHNTIIQASKVFDLPGLTYYPTFDTYSGYLNGSNAGSSIHYWFIESQNSFNHPLVFWFSGSVGCSSIAGMLSEMGPFRPNPDGTTLYENVFSWNKKAHMVFMNIPNGVGFSWGANQGSNFNDDQAAEEAVNAIINWLSTYSNYSNKEIFIGGEVYGGILVPLIAKSIANKIDNGNTFLKSLNFSGILIGNGHLSNKC